MRLFINGIEVDACGFCVKSYYKGSSSCPCNYYCGENRKRLREQILKTSM